MEPLKRPASEVSKVAETARHRRVRARGEEIRGFILTNIEKNSSDIARLVGERFGISRQAVNKHLKNLVTEGALVPEGKTRYRKYKLAALLEWRKRYTLGPEIEEDLVWSRDVSLVLGNLPKNVMDIWHFCITEMFNNAIDHSGGKTVFVKIAKTAANTQIMLMDDGVGIFKKIQSAMRLMDERHAILELAKGKLTTDPKGHTGQGIFFTSRVLDSFDILSHGVFFTHTFGAEEDWILERPEATDGTTVFMKLNNHSARTDKQIFDQYSSGEDYGFTKTVVPVRLAQYGDDKLISRSQAKRLLARVDRFKTVLFDFRAVETVGQAFADEIFRVFAQGHPNIAVTPINATPQVQQMINAARSQWARDVDGL
jgi:anti-sigma regulatory factor (Ser/Thr protein kinase)/biotin operon repressor